MHQYYVQIDLRIMLMTLYGGLEIEPNVRNLE